MKELPNQGISTQVKRADPVLPNEEQALWDRGVFNIDLSTGLSYIVFSVKFLVSALLMSTHNSMHHSSAFQ
jgi:hypothetical protein